MCLSSVNPRVSLDLSLDPDLSRSIFKGIVTLSDQRSGLVERFSRLIFFAPTENGATDWVRMAGWPLGTIQTDALNGLWSWANAEHASAEPEPMLSLSMTILAKSSDLGQIISLKSDDII